MKVTTLISVASITATLLCLHCGELMVNEPASTKNLADFQTAWQLAHKYYPFFAFKKVNWDSLHIVFSSRASMAKGDEIYFLLYDLFKELRDGHVVIYTPGGFVIPTYLWERYRDHTAFRPEVVQSYFEAPLKLAGDKRMAYGLIDSTIGYIYFPTFAEGEWIRELDDILGTFQNTRGCILDLRNNNGGSSRTYHFVLSRFLNEPLQETIFFADGSSKTVWISPNGTNPYRGRVIILINGASFSAAEIFAEEMRQLPNVAIVGDTSGGGGGAAEIFRLPSGKKLKLPVKYFKRRDGKMIEWNGILPDHLVEQTETDMRAERDRQLEYSLQLLRDLDKKASSQSPGREKKSATKSSLLPLP